ncbi:MAG: UPF0755 protein [Halioglobus sp.]|jgi:UPF0755 protein
MIRRMAILVLVLAATVYFVGERAFQYWSQPLNLPAEGVRITIEPGERLRGVTGELERRGILPHPYLMLIYARWTGLDERIKRGEYQVEAGTKPEQFLRQLAKGDVVQYKVTFPEGITLRKAIALLGAQEQLAKELTGLEDPRITAIRKPHASAEGLFFPDTYQYEKGATDWHILRRAYEKMQLTLETEWNDKTESLPYETAYEALIMASIVERETGAPQERATIAGVFVKRLRKKMRLQTDPTVIYGLGENFDGNLRRRHLQDESNPYNTYRHKGLPPTPIAMPGLAAIRAALHPDESNLLYFVAKGDGSHEFSSNLKDHQIAVRKYQLKRTSDYRSSPGKK